MTSAKEMQNLAREEQTLLRLFQKYTDLIDNQANEGLLRKYCDENYLPIEDSSLEAAVDELYEGLSKHPKPPAQRPSASPAATKEEPPKQEKRYFGQDRMSADQLDRVRKEGVVSYDPLPPEIDRNAIRRADSVTLRGWMQRYGADAITARHNQSIQEN
jgi:hypothetical protein